MRTELVYKTCLVLGVLFKCDDISTECTHTIGTMLKRINDKWNTLMKLKKDNEIPMCKTNVGNRGVPQGWRKQCSCYHISLITYCEQDP